MSDFKIRVGVDLDTEDLQNQLEKLGKTDIKLGEELNLNKIETQLNRIKNTFKNTFKFDKGFIKDINKLTNALDKLSRSGANTNLVNNTVSQYKDLANTVTKLQKQLNKGGLGEESIKRTTTQIDKLKAKMDELKSQMSSSQKKSLELFDFKNENKYIVDLNNDLNKIEVNVASLQTKLNSISFEHINTDVISKLENKLKEIKNIAKDIDVNVEPDGINNILSDLSKIESEIKNLEKVEKLASSFDKIANSANEAGMEIKDLDSIIDNLVSGASRLDGSFEKAFSNAKNEATELKNEIKKVKSTMDKTSKSSGSSLLGSWDDFKGNFAQFTLAEVAGDFISSAIRSAINGIIDTVVETDKAITDLGKVYDGLNGDKLKAYLEDVTNVAKITGKESVDVIQGTSKAIQSGIKNINDALIFAQQSAIFSNVSDMEQEQADQILTSVLSAYGGVEQSLKPVREQVQGMSKDYTTLNKIMDLSNYAGNRYAVTSADVGEALQNSASALQTNGVAMEESVAMIVAINEILQDASKSGNSLKSISAGLSGVTVSAKDGSIQLTKSGKALKEIAKIDVWNEKTGEIKDMYEIMDELYEKWDDLSEAEQNALGTSIAGKTQLNSFNALLSNWETARQYVQDYKNGLTIGSAERENLKYLDSIQGKWNVIKENLKEVANTLISSDMAKGFLDGLILITDGLNSFVKGLSNAFSTLANGDLGRSISNYIYEAFENLGINSKFTTSLSSGVGNAIGGIFEGIKDFAMGNTLLGQFQRISGMIQKIANLFPEDSFMDIMGDRLASVDETIDYKFLGGQKRLNNQIAEREENIQSIKTEVQALENQKKAIDDVMEEYDKLSSKTNRTTKENERLKEIQNQLAESNPDLVLGYDSDGNAILKNLKLQNKEIESQILLKRQAQRLEENELANDVLKRKTKEQKDYNKTIEEYNNMSNVSSTKRKEGLFGEESIQEYAARIKENNKEIAESNEEVYNQRLKDHQQYLADEKALQEKYINRMEISSNFGKKTEEQQADILTFMDSLDWTNFDTVTGNRFTDQLSELDNEIVRNTEDMGEYSKAIQQLTDDYASGKINLKQYTDGLTEQYKASGKFDTESFLAWKQGLQQYVDLTGDIKGANKAVNEMAETLHEVTGINVETWKTALSFDPAPIDASNKALQKFLKTYGTGVQNLGKGGDADKYAAQFQSLQASYEQMVSDLADGKEIDVEYLVNATVGNPDCIQKLVQEIVKDGEVTDEEMELLLNVQASILNGEDLSDELITQIAEYFGISEQEVRVMLNVDAKKTKEAEEIKGFWENVKDKVLELSIKVLGEKTVKDIQEAWKNIKNKVVDFTVKTIGEENIEKIKETWEKVKSKAVELKIKVSDAIKKIQEKWEEIKSKTVELTTKIKNSEIVQKIASLWEKIKTKTAEIAVNIKNFDLSKELEKIWSNIKSKVAELAVKILGEENIEKLSEAWGVFKDRVVELTTKIKNSETVQKILEVWEKFKNKVVELTTKIKDGETIQKILELWEKFKSKTVELTTKIKNSEIVQKILELWEKFKSKTAELTAKIKNSKAVQKVLELWEKIKSKTAEIAIKVKEGILETVSELWVSFRDKTVELICSILNGEALQSLKDKWEAIKSKVVNLTAQVTGTELVSTLKGYWEAVKSKVTTLTAQVTGTELVQKLKDLWAFIKTKTTTLTAKVSGTSAVETLKNLWSSIKSKTVEIKAKVTTIGKTLYDNTIGKIVNKRSIEVPTNPSTPMLTNSSLASVPVSASASPLSDTPVTISDNSLSSVPVSTRASSYGTLDASKILPSLDLGISHIKNLEEALERLGSQLDFINEKSEATFGQEKVNLLQQQIPLLKEQQKIQEQIANSERKQNNELINWLNNNGFKFDTLGNITNYNDKLLQMEQNVESLKKKHDDLNSVSGDNKNEKAIKAANDAYENANETLSKAKKYLEEYFTTNNKEITEASKKWWELENAIREVNDELEELRRNNSIEPLQNSLQEVEYLLDRQSDRLDLLDAQYEKATGEKRVEGLIKKEQILNEQLATQEEAYKRIYNLAAGLQKDLWQFGFKLDGNSLITNYDEVLNALVGTSEYERAKKYADEYMDVVRGDLIDIQKEAYETQNAIADLAEEMQEALDEAREERLAPFKNTLESVRYELDRVTDRLDLLDSANERSQGKTKVDYLHDKIGLLNEEIATSQKEFSALYNLIVEAQNDLWQYGFRLDENSLIDNYDGVLNGLVGTEKYESAKKAADEYMSLMRDDYIENKLSISDLQNEIKELQDEIEKAERELALFSSTNRLTELNEEFEELSNKIDVIGTKLEHAYGTDKITLMRKEIELLNYQLELQDKKMNTMLEQAQTYTDSLSKYGFTFDENGSISNYAEILDIFRDDEQIENIKELCEEYMDLQDEISGLSSEYANLESAVKDAYKEMLDTTEDIEKEITEVIEKEYEKRKEEIEKYTDERIALLEKEKKEMQELWDEQDYEKSVKEQSDEIMELQKRISILSKDTSIAGQQKLKELTEELEEAQKKLEEITEDKIKDDYTNNIDGEIEKLEDEEKTLLEALDEKFSETNIATMVQKALTTGFIELNGEMQSIQDALINNINQSADAYSAMAEIIKNELVANLNVALSTTRELSSIYENLDLNEYGRISALENIALSTPSGSTNASNISFGDTVFNISGSADNTTLEQVEEMIRQSQDEMLDKITRNV